MRDTYEEVKQQLRDLQADIQHLEQQGLCGHPVYHAAKHKMSLTLDLWRACGATQEDVILFGLNDAGGTTQ